ncbi:MAG: hypothetical protein OXC15_14350 [Rhodospirillaceae bacterium]|nr:hypothetical protein [Rhodospirillaceae bacterium]
MNGPDTSGAFRPFAAAAVAVVLALASPAVATAKDLGVRGMTWAVAEPDLLGQIESRLLEMERSGELARLEQEARANARRKLEEPDPVPGIAPATRAGALRPGSAWGSRRAWSSRPDRNSASPRSRSRIGHRMNPNRRTERC